MSATEKRIRIQALIQHTFCPKHASTAICENVAMDSMQFWVLLNPSLDLICSTSSWLHHVALSLMLEPKHTNIQSLHHSDRTVDYRVDKSINKALQEINYRDVQTDLRPTSFPKLQISEKCTYLIEKSTSTSNFSSVMVPDKLQSVGTRRRTFRAWK